MTRHTIILNGDQIRWLQSAGRVIVRTPIKFPKHAYFPGDSIDWIKSVLPDGGGNWIAASWPDSPEARVFVKKQYPNGEGIPCPYAPGSVLRVRETWWMDYEDQPIVFYAATDARSDVPLKSAATMPAWASRYSVRVESVTVEPKPWTWVVELKMVP